MVLVSASRAVRPGEPGRAQRVHRRSRAGSAENHKNAQPRRADRATGFRLRGLWILGAFQQSLRTALKLKARVLMNLAAGNGGDALHEIKDAFRLAIFFAQNDFNDFRRL